MGAPRRARDSGKFARLLPRCHGPHHSGIGVWQVPRLCMNSASILHIVASSNSSIGDWMVFALIISLIVWSLRWTYRDAESRGKDGCIVTALVFFISWPISLIAWIAFRPARTNAPPSPPPQPKSNVCGQCGISLRYGQVSCHWCGWNSQNSKPPGSRS
jgi:hypothetical protein